MKKSTVNPIGYSHQHESMRRYAEHLNLVGLAERSCESYYRQIRLIAEHHKCDPAWLKQEQLRQWFVRVKCERRWAPKSLRLGLVAARRFYNDMLERDWALFGLIRARDREYLPSVLSTAELRAIFARVPLLRYRIPLALIYTSGLRISECVKLTVNDIDGANHKLIVREGKGGKDRYTLLSFQMYRQLQKYWRCHRNPVWLFPQVGRGGGSAEKVRQRMGAASEPMGSGSLQSRMRKAAVRAGVTKKASCHTLRHSFATHLLEAGIPVTQLQEYLGHEHVETTTIYTHLTPVCHDRALACIERMTRSVL